MFPDSVRARDFAEMWHDCRHIRDVIEAMRTRRVTIADPGLRALLAVLDAANGQAQSYIESVIETLADLDVINEVEDQWRDT